jgi:hypothetical protein
LATVKQPWGFSQLPSKLGAGRHHPSNLLTKPEDLLHERGIDISHETVQYWWNRFGPMFAAEIRGKRVEAMRPCRQLRWHLDETA